MDYCFKAGTVTLVLGRSGTGKTMLIELLSGLREPLSGEIKLGSLPLWKGASTRQIPNRQVLLRMGTAFQHPEQQLFADTIRGEFLYTLRPYKLSRDELSNRMVSGLRLFTGDAGHWLGRDPFTLSGGQQRRLSLALLEAAAPVWLLLDEPTAGIDLEGAALICEQLQKRKEQGHGTIVVTHDPEAFIAIADAVLILYAGTFWHGSPGELAEQPHVWREAGLALPAPLETLRTLREAGFNVPKGWPNAAEVAAAIAAGRSKAAPAGQWQLEKETQATEISKQAIATNERLGQDEVLEVLEAEQTQEMLTSALSKPLILNQPYYSKPDSGQPSFSGLKQRDPRAVWLAYMLISPGILLQSHWIGWLTSFMVMLGVIRYAHIPLRECMKPAAGLIVFTLLASVLSGLSTQTTEYPTEYTDTADFAGIPDFANSTGSAGSSDSANFTGFASLVASEWQLPWGLLFDTGPAAETLFLLSLLVMIMLIGFVLLSGINHLRLKRALEQSLQPLKRLRVPVDQFALAASLIIRFLPMIMEEWQRFARIAAARGKYPFRPGQIPIFRLRMTMIPILVSLLRLGELLSLILIVRGVGQGGAKPTIAYRLLFNRLDWLLILAAAGILLCFILIQYLLRI
jgi:energy-coupling factor transport system ATP-binding protein